VKRYRAARFKTRRLQACAVCVALIALVGGGQVHAQDAQPSVTIERAAYRVDEGSNLTVQLTLSQASTQPVTAHLTLEDRGATVGRDLRLGSSTVAWNPGQTLATVTLEAVDDRKHETDERALLSIDRAQGAEIGFQSRALIALVDNDPPQTGRIDGFESDSSPFAAAPNAASVVTVPHGAAHARPDQDPLEGMLDVPASQQPVRLRADFGSTLDWSQDEALTFWYRGRGDGQPVTVTVHTEPTDGSGWTVRFEDTFDGPAGTLPNENAWQLETGDGSAQGIPGWGNGELQTYTRNPSNVAHDGRGHLVITAREAGEDAPMCHYGEPCRYTSARLKTQDRVEFQYGRVEARLKIPSGAGLWPAFWMLGADIDARPWPLSGEIDIMENIGREPYTVHGTVHGPGYAGANGIGAAYNHPSGERFSDAFHTYAVEWAPNELRWFVDDVRFHTLTPENLPAGAAWVFNRPYFMLLNVAVGGYWPGPPRASTVFPQSLVVDHVRVLERTGQTDAASVSFVDDAAGWRRVSVPLNGWTTTDGSPEEAPSARLERVVGMEFEFGPGEAVMLDALRTVR
jgi:beta-glucanase (GH16 family)